MNRRDFVNKEGKRHTMYSGHCGVVKYLSCRAAKKDYAVFLGGFLSSFCIFSLIKRPKSTYISSKAAF